LNENQGKNSRILLISLHYSAAGVAWLKKNLYRVLLTINSVRLPIHHCLGKKDFQIGLLNIFFEKGKILLQNAQKTARLKKIFFVRRFF
jgi:hypothetical protein